MSSLESRVSTMWSTVFTLESLVSRIWSPVTDLQALDFSI